MQTNEQLAQPADQTHRLTVQQLFNSDPAALEHIGLKAYDLQQVRHQAISLDLSKQPVIEASSGIALLAVIDAGYQAANGSAAGVGAYAFCGEDGKPKNDTVFLAAGNEDVYQPMSPRPSGRDGRGYHQPIFIQAGAKPRVYGRGHSTSSRLDLNHDEISRNHFSVELDKRGRLKIRDLDSANGTTVVVRDHLKREQQVPSRLLQAAEHLVARTFDEPPEFKVVEDSQVAREKALLADIENRSPEEQVIVRQIIDNLHEFAVGPRQAPFDPAVVMELQSPEHGSPRVAALIDGETPPATRAALADLYDLTDAWLVGEYVIDQPKGDTPDAKLRLVCREGNYYGKKVIFTELFKTDGPDFKAPSARLSAYITDRTPNLHLL